MSADDWGDWIAVTAPVNFAATLDGEYQRIDGQWRARFRPRKPVVETVTLYCGGNFLSAGVVRSGQDTHTIALTKIDGVWQREAVLEPLK